MVTLFVGCLVALAVLMLLLRHDPAYVARVRGGPAPPARPYRHTIIPPVLGSRTRSAGLWLLVGNWSVTEHGPRYRWLWVPVW